MARERAQRNRGEHRDMILTSWKNILYHWCPQAHRGSQWGRIYDGKCEECEIQFRVTNLFKHLEKHTIWRVMGDETPPRERTIEI